MPSDSNFAIAHTFIPRPEQPTDKVRHYSDQVEHSSNGHKRLAFSDIEAPKLTHYLFRFPAKFHPPVVHSLIREYTSPGQTILDPFCGSGTLLVSAAFEERHAVGSDIDPVAAFVSKMKTHRFRPTHLRNSWTSLRPILDEIRRCSTTYDECLLGDLAAHKYQDEISTFNLRIPNIPNIHHWFRRYVIIDLARILAKIELAEIPETHRNFFRLIFASIIRNVSNADPVPVSGLEVTAHMRRLDAAGRRIDPFDTFYSAVERGLGATEAYWTATNSRPRIQVLNENAVSLSSRVRRPIDAVITSPPYHSAVDYYRRHQLEMYWLGFTKTHSDRLELRPRYIGQPRVRKDDFNLRRYNELDSLSACWYTRILNKSKERADAFVHYMISMKDVFHQLSRLVPPGAPVLFVVGNSEWKGQTIPTADLFSQLAADHFSLADTFWYPVKNRYMTYSRHNGANIGEEFVLIFERQRP